MGSTAWVYQEDSENAEARTGPCDQAKESTEIGDNHETRNTWDRNSRISSRARALLEDCRAAAIKFKIARELEKAMSERKITKAEMARRLKTSRTGVDRLLDPENTSITLNTMAKVAHLLGKRIEFVLQ